MLELLVVIAIIGLLSALLLPALSAAKSFARSVSCKNHLRQMGMALQMYVHDYQNQYPRYLGAGDSAYGDAYGPGSAPNLVYWSSKLIPYYPLNWTNRARHCPGYKGKISGPYQPDSIDRLGSYGYNAFGVAPIGPKAFFGLGPVRGWKNANGTLVPPVAEIAVRVPSEMLAMGDTFLKVGMDGAKDFWQPGGMATSLAAQPFALPHGENHNALLCDGHVSAMSPWALFNRSNTAAMWNYDHQPHPELWPP